MLCKERLYADIGETPVVLAERSVNFRVNCGGDDVYARIMLPALMREDERTPCVVLLHGYPGLERNMDIPYALRRAGIACVYFSYRGVWGSKGSYCFSHLIEDTLCMLDHLREKAEKWHLDPEHLYLVGHSMGGFATLNAIARGAKVRGAICISPCDMGMRCIDEPERFADMMLTPRSGYFTMPNESYLEDDTRAHAHEWRFTALADKIPQTMPLRFIGGKKDSTCETETHILPLYNLLKARGMDVTLAEANDGHAYSAHRIWLTNTIFDYIEEMEQ